MNPSWLNLFLKTSCQPDFICYIKSNRNGPWTYQVLHALQNFPASQQLLNAIRSCDLSIWNSLRSLYVNTSLGAGENLTNWHHMRLNTPAELWGLITHILVCLWGLFQAGGMTEKEITSLCCLSTFAWIFPRWSSKAPNRGTLGMWLKYLRRNWLISSLGAMS